MSGQAPPVPGQPQVPGRPPAPPTAPPTYGGPPYGPPASGPPVYAPPAYAPPPYAPTAYAPTAHVPTAYVPVPQGPSPIALFLRRTFSGDWTGPLKAGLWPTAVLLALAALLATQSNRQTDEADLGYGDRLRGYLAMVLQGVGGIFGARITPGDGGSSSDDYDGSTAAPFLRSSTQDTFTLSLVPLVVTILWALALVLALRHLRRTQTGAEAAIRVAAVCTAAALVLALVAQPSITVTDGESGDRIDITSGPFTVLLWTFVLSLLVGLFVLCRDRLDGHLSTSPGLAAATRALRAAILALGIGVGGCALIVLIVLADHSDEMDNGSWMGISLLIVNGGLSALGLAWGVPVEATRSGSGYEHERLGLSDLGQFGHGWAVPGALAAGVVCALILGVVAVRRCADRREQWLAAGFYAGLFVLLIAIGGTKGTYAEGTRSATVEAASSVPEALLFGLLWAFGGVLAVTFILRVRAGGPGGTPGYPPAYPPGYGQPSQPGFVPAQDLPAQDLPSYGGQPYDAPSAGGFTEPELLLNLNAPAGKPGRAPRNRLLVVGLIMLGAFAIGGVATAGVIMFNRNDDKPATPSSCPSAPASSGDSTELCAESPSPGDDSTSGEPSPSDSTSDEPSPSDSTSDEPSPSDSPSDTPSETPTDDPFGSPSDSPAGLPSSAV
ncbi:MSCRAMM family adhesin SdrC [Streptomyces sp. RKAG337]|uniref:MSCRAMM family adhesin SdrC n=1 Tax=Streptomyces sp. RKAG337 TaxID=2893404 RepID=UPI0020347B44|nr:MSCRAMM family adhesin SdrC [Streptomyces sp. RKAG337]MCM2426843.1 MSCRAMM family adhesin SdrC [Streptomyces sp. RKAG337]